jgi:hypothetical protein
MKTNQLQGSLALTLVRKQLASCYSIAAQVICRFSLKKVVQIYLPACSQKQYEEFMEIIQHKVIYIHTIGRGSRLLIFCDTYKGYSDELTLQTYHMALEHVFANEQGKLTMPYAARIYQAANFEQTVL